MNYEDNINTVRDSIEAGVQTEVILDLVKALVKNAYLRGQRDVLIPKDEILETDVQVAPGIWQSKEDYEANHRFDEARDNEL